MERVLTCITCPLGCSLHITIEGQEVVAVSGNQCPRGAVYAEMECTDPRRTVTTTMRCCDGAVISVKTSDAIPKKHVKACVTCINSAVAKIPVRIGDVVLHDIFGCDVIATQNHPAEK